MSNSAPSAIVLHGIPCIGGLYLSFDSKGEIGSLNFRCEVRRVSFDPRRQLVNYCRPCRADDFVLGIRASRATDCTDNRTLVDRPLVDQGNAAARRNDSIERRVLTVDPVGALSDFDDIAVRIADVAAYLAVLGDRWREELGSSTFP